MEGYERTPDTVGILVEALRTAMYAHPTQRLGQILVNSGLADVDLSNIYDEDLARHLFHYSELGA